MGVAISGLGLVLKCLRRIYAFSHFSNYLPHFCLSSCYSVWAVIEEQARNQEKGRVWAVALAPHLDARSLQKALPGVTGAPSQE